MNILEVKNITKNYALNNHRLGSAGRLEAVKDVSFNLKAGETLAIVGESGSGKSTLARQVIGIEKPNDGQVVFDGVEQIYHSRKQRKYRFRNIRMVFQNPYESLNPQARIGTTLDQVLQINTKLGPRQRRRKIELTLSKVGLLPDHQYRYPHMFSGGQRQRIAIARAIIVDPKVIIADEPLSALDVSIQAQILNLLQELQEELEISYVFISHDLNVVEHIADNVLVMFRGVVVESGTVEQVYDNPLHPYTQSLFASTPTYRKRFQNQVRPLQIKRPGLSQEGCRFASRCHLCDPDCIKSQPSLESNANGHKVACFKIKL